MRGRDRAEAALNVALICLAAWLVAIVADRWPVRLDLTADGRFTLPQPTQALLRGLDGELRARVFLPATIQAPYSTVVRGLRDKLEAYRAASGGHLRLRYLDPTDESLSPTERSALEQEAKALGIPEAELEITDGDRRLRQRIFMGVALLYRDRQVAIPFARASANFDAALFGAIREVLRGRQPASIGIATGHGEPDLTQSPLAPLLERSGHLRPVEIGDAPLPVDLDALLVIAPARPFTPRQRYLLDQFVMHGRGLLLLLDYRVRTPAFPEVIVQTTTGLEPLLDAWGLHVEARRIVLDRARNRPAVVGRDRAGRPITAHHPLYPLITDLDTGHPATAGLSHLVIPMASPIDLTKAHANPALQVSELARSAPGSVSRLDLRAFDPAVAGKPKPDAERPGPAVVAAALRGPLLSPFAGRPIPPRSRPPRAGDRLDPPTRARSEGEARVILVTSAGPWLATDENGVVFLQNAVDWLVQDPTLGAPIRARQATDPPLRATTSAERAALRYGNLLGPPLLLLLLGLLRWRRRRGPP